LWLADKGLQQEKSRKSEKQRKKVSFFLGETLDFLPKQAVFWRRNLQVAAVVRVKNDAKLSGECDANIKN
jgi:hypothetical protein